MVSVQAAFSDADYSKENSVNSKKDVPFLFKLFKLTVLSHLALS